MSDWEAATSNLRQLPDVQETTVVRMLRRFILAILAFAMAGTFIDLVLLDHDGDVWQMIPLGLLGLAGVALVWSSVGGSAISVRGFQISMTLLLMGGILGTILHGQASAEFHRELDSAASRWQIISTVLRSQVPPIFAPASLMHMGLMGLASTYRHPAIRRRDIR